MKSLLTGFALSTLFTSLAFATNAGYELTMNLKIDGKQVASPRIITIAGEKASIAQRDSKSKDGSFIEVVASEPQDGKGILLNLVVGTIDRDGKKTILGKPSILTNENEQASVSVGENSGKDSFELSVVAQRKALQN